MVLRVLCQESRGRRCIALVTDDHLSLTFHAEYASGSSHGASSVSDIASPKCIVRLSRDVNWRDRRSCWEMGKGQGTIGLVNFGSNLFLGVITVSSRVATVRPGETVRKIDGVEFYCLNTSFFDEPSLNVPRGTYRDNYNASDDYNPREPLQNPCASLQKLLVDGSFYYSLDFDLTDRLQDRVSQRSAFDIESLDQDFLWNSFLITPLLQFRRNLPEAQKNLIDSSGILTSVIRGSVQSTNIPASSSPSSLRGAGMRFYSRGIDDEGNVSNSVETETILYLPSRVSFSYTQVRGSIPCFWEQAAHISGQQRIQITRSPAATQPAFNKHFDSLQLSYGPIHVVNLLSRSKQAEADLVDRFHHHISQSPLKHKPGSLLQETLFDFHAETNGPSGYQAASVISHYIKHSIDSFGYFLSGEDVSGNCQVIMRQEGVFRTNCLDCLDRTNFIQTLISRMVLEMFLGQNDGYQSEGLWRYHSALWADNGDLLSKNYTGTGALKSSFTRHGKMSFAGTFSDFRKSATRFLYNHLLDGPRQQAIDLLLGTLSDVKPVELVDPLNDAVNSELKEKSAEFSSYKRIRIWTGTFNVNGKEEGIDSNLSPWLWSHMDNDNDGEEPQIVVVAFQEIVELSPQQIMSTDPFLRYSWENTVIQNLNSFAQKRSSANYTLLRSGQLVGTALMVFAQEDLVPQIRNIEWAEKKTGLSGMAGNKGGVAIRMEVASTKICFVTAHLAAGQLNVDERDRDYMTISTGLQFVRSRTIDDHDAIIWLGDFNYRINLDKLKTRDLMSTGNTETLLLMDQLQQQMQIGYAFQDYNEGLITFPPTYKFDHGTDIYDTSEQARTPAWTDRILWKGDILRQLQYMSALLRCSDHRPVFAVFDCEITLIDEPKKTAMCREIYERLRPNQAIHEPDLLDFSGDDVKFGSSPQNIPRSDTDNAQALSNLSGTPLSEQWDHISNDSELFPRSTPNTHRTHQTSSSSLSSDNPAHHPQTLQKSAVAPPPPPPRSSTLPYNFEPSMSNLSLKKRAPPIPRKPVSLLGRPQTMDMDLSRSDASMVSRRPQMSALSSNLSSKSMSPPTLPPRSSRYEDNLDATVTSRSVGGSPPWQRNIPPLETRRGALTANPLTESPASYSLPSQTSRNIQQTSAAAPQPPPPRRKNSSTATPALLDDGPDGLEGWEPLKPS